MATCLGATRRQISRCVGRFLTEANMDKPAADKTEATEPQTRKIRQGLPSYSEPGPEIAGIIGKVTRGRPVKATATPGEDSRPRKNLTRGAKA